MTMHYKATFKNHRNSLVSKITTWKHRDSVALIGNKGQSGMSFILKIFRHKPELSGFVMRLIPTHH